MILLIREPVHNQDTEGTAIMNFISKHREEISLKLLFALVLITLGIRYWQTMPPGVSSLQIGGWNDSAAMQVVGAYWGVAHSPGYPLYTVLANLFVHLGRLLIPQIEPARLVSSFSIVCALVSLGFVFEIQRRLVIKPWLALVTVATLATSPTFWRYAIMAEVYMLNLALIMIGVWLALRWKQAGKELPFLAGIGVVFGATIAHHRTGIVAVFVVFLWMIWVRRTDGWRIWLWRLKIMAVAAIPFSLFYGYLPLAARLGAGKTRIYADATQPAILLFMVLSREWWGLVKTPASLAAAFRSTAQLLQQQAHELGGWVLLLLSSLGLAIGGQQSLLPLGLAIAFTGFGIIYAVNDVYSMLIPLTALLMVGLAWCVNLGVIFLQRRLPWRSARNGILWLVIISLSCFPGRALIWPPVDEHNDTVGLDMVEAIRIWADDGIPLTVVAEGNTPLAIVQYARARHKLESVEPLSATYLASLYPVSADTGQERRALADEQVRSILQARWDAGRLIFVSSEVLEHSMVPEVSQGLANGTYFVASTTYPDLKLLLPATRFPPLARSPEYSVTTTSPTDLGIIGYDCRWIMKRSGIHLRIALYWMAQEKTGRDYWVSFHPTGHLADVINAAEFTNLLLGSYPPKQLEPGAVLKDAYELRLNALPSDWNLSGLEISYGELGGPAAPVIQVPLPPLPEKWPS